MNNKSKNSIKYPILLKTLKEGDKLNKSNDEEMGDEEAKEDEEEKGENDTESVPTSYECPQCGFQFTCLMKLDNHLKYHTREHPYICSTCGSSFLYMRDLKKHERKFDGTCKNNVQSSTKKNEEYGSKKGNPTEFVCEICDKTFSRYYGLVRHTRIHTGERPYACLHCDKRFLDSGDLTKHLKAHEGETSLQCKICNKICISKQKLDDHMFKHNDEDRFKCEVCQKVCRQRSHLEEHMRSHTKEKPFECPQCSQFYRYKSQLRLHMLTKHPTDGCEIKCQKSDAVLASSHTECHICGAILSQISIKRHMLLHTEKRFKCDECDKAYISKYHLTVHKRSHTGERPFMCKVPGCGKGLTTKDGLARHMTIHAGQKNHQCPHCEKQFFNKSNLTQHMRIHGGPDVKHYICPECNKKFSRKSFLNKHRLNSCAGQSENSDTSLCKEEIVVETSGASLRGAPIEPPNNEENQVADAQEFTVAQDAPKGLDNIMVNSSGDGITTVVLQTDNSEPAVLSHEFLSSLMNAANISIDSTAAVNQVNNLVFVTFHQESSEDPISETTAQQDKEVDRISVDSMLKENTVHVSPTKESTVEAPKQSYIFIHKSEDNDTEPTSVIHLADIPLEDNPSSVAISLPPEPIKVIENISSLCQEPDLVVKEPVTVIDENLIFTDGPIEFSSNLSNTNVRTLVADSSTGSNALVSQESATLDVEYRNPSEISDDLENSILVFGKDVNSFNEDTVNSSVDSTKVSSQNDCFNNNSEINGDESMNHISDCIKFNAVSSIILEESLKAKDNVISKETNVPLYDSGEDNVNSVENSFLECTDERNPTILIYNCLHCPEVFKFQYEIEKHCQSQHPGLDIYKCFDCGATFECSKSLNKHVIVHYGSSSMQCNICNKMFTHPGKLSSHMTTHTGSKPKRYSCDYCEAQFSDVANLRTHVTNVHLGNRPYACKHCGNRYAKKTDWEIHERIHTGEMPFQCPECKKCFRAERHLKKHMFVHSEAKPFQCSECNKGYTSRFNLIVHMMNHAGNKPYKCDWDGCEKAYSDKRDLKHHRFTHTGEKPHKCPICGKGFSMRFNMYQHQKIHNKEKLSNTNVML